MALDSPSKKWLTDLLGPQVAFDVPMGRYTYFKVGGPADAVACPENPENLAELVRGAVAKKLPYWIVGGGTNLLVTDGGIRGLVIRLARGFDAISSTKDGEFTAMAGVKLQSLCRYAAERGWAGMVFATGIPGTVGGALIMNAGTAAGAMADRTASITVMDASGAIRTIQRRDLSFGYRRLTWNGYGNGAPMHAPIIVGCCMHLTKSDPEQIKARMRARLEERRRTQPLDLPSAGCFFKNPANGPTAGQLIEQAGLKGKRVGGAVVSDKHANFIVNKGGATAGDIRKLSAEIQAAVLKKFNVALAPEVKIVGV